MWFNPRSELAEIKGDPLARDVAAAKATAAALADPDGVARTPEANEVQNRYNVRLASRLHERLK